MMTFRMLVLKKRVQALCLLFLALMFSMPPTVEAAERGSSHAKQRTAAQKAAATRASGKSRVVVKKSVTRPATLKQARRSEAARGLHAKAPTKPSLRHVAGSPRASVGEKLGLREHDDPLDIRASVALVVDQETHEVLFSKNDSAVLPIASLTKLMTGMVVADAGLSMDEPITITQADVDTQKGSGSRLPVGSTLTRGELMHLSLMSSENRAAHALGRTYPGGLQAFVRRMNETAKALGMQDTRYVEPTGLSSDNRSSARDLATLVAAAYERPVLRELSTSPGRVLDLGRRSVQYSNSNKLVHDPAWDIGLQKTGYISEAGRCLVMQANVLGRNLIMVLLDAPNKAARLTDAERMRRLAEIQTLMQWQGPLRPQS